MTFPPDGDLVGTAVPRCLSIDAHAANLRDDQGTPVRVATWTGDT